MTRGYLTKREWDALLASQGGKCCVADCESTGPFHGEHSTPNAWQPGKPDQLMCIPHHKIKTAHDRREMGRANRANGKSLSQAERRRRFGPTFKSRNTFQDKRNG